MPNYLDRKYDGGYASAMPAASDLSASTDSPTDTEILDWLDKNTRDDYPFEGWMQELHFGKDHCNTLREWAIHSMENAEIDHK